MEIAGVDLGDGLPRLLDLRFADNFLIFAIFLRKFRAC